MALSKGFIGDDTVVPLFLPWPLSADGCGLIELHFALLFGGKADQQALKWVFSVRMPVGTGRFWSGRCRCRCHILGVHSLLLQQRKFALTRVPTTPEPKHLHLSTVRSPLHQRSRT